MASGMLPALFSIKEPDRLNVDEAAVLIGMLRAIPSIIPVEP